MTDDVWREFFDSCAPQYMNEVFTAGSAREAAFLVDRPRSLPLRERSYVSSELAVVCRTAGFAAEHVWGGTAGDWGRRPVELDEMEIMVVVRRPPA